MKTKKQIALEQIQIQSDMQSAGFNIVTCGSCGSILLHLIRGINESNLIDCFCGQTMSLSDCPDYWYEGLELSKEFEEDYIKYKKINYKIRTLIVEDKYREPRQIKLASISLYEAMRKEVPFFQDNSIEEMIDNSIYFYIEDEAINWSAEAICAKCLDEELFLIEEV